jgi:hypothetical protein
MHVAGHERGHPDRPDRDRPIDRVVEQFDEVVERELVDDQRREWVRLSRTHSGRARPATRDRRSPSHASGRARTSARRTADGDAPRGKSGRQHLMEQGRGDVCRGSWVAVGCRSSSSRMVRPGVHAREPRSNGVLPGSVGAQPFDLSPGLDPVVAESPCTSRRCLPVDALRRSGLCQYQNGPARSVVVSVEDVEQWSFADQVRRTTSEFPGAFAEPFRDLRVDLRRR